MPIAANTSTVVSGPRGVQTPATTPHTAATPTPTAAASHLLDQTDSTDERSHGASEPSA